MFAPTGRMTGGGFGVWYTLLMNILYLLETLKTKELEELVANIDAPLLDINVALWEAEKAGEIEVDREKGRVKRLKKAEKTFNADLADKILKTVQHYADNETNLTIGKLTSWVKNPAMEHNYPYHEYITTLQYLIDSGQLLEQEATLPKIKGRPFHRFVFLCLPEHEDQSEEWNAKEINKFIAKWEQNKVQ